MTAQMEALRRCPPVMSCVEGYFVCWLEENQIDPSALYCQSFISADKALKCAQENEFAYFDGFPRIQDTAESLDLTRHERLKRLPEPEPGELLLARSAREFFQDFKQIPWRPDHYIRLLPDREHGYRYINSYPLCEGIINEDKVPILLTGDALAYRLTGRPAQLGDKNQKQLEKIAAGGGKPDILNANTEQLRDALLILKISRSRMLAWLPAVQGNYGCFACRTAEILKKELALIARQMAACERIRLKGGDNAPVCAGLNALYELDRELARIVHLQFFAAS